MRKFFLRALLLIVPVILFFVILLLIPSPKYLAYFMLYSQIEKDKLLKDTPGPRIIFIGGSNISFGLDCQMIKDSLSLNPVNTGIIANIGLKYMLRNTLKYIRPNDVIVISPEYQQFYGDLADGLQDVLVSAFDVSPDTKKLLDPLQSLKLIRYIPSYCLDKFDPVKFNSARKHPALTKSYAYITYGRLSYDRYGDACKHWYSPRKTVIPLGLDGDLNDDAFKVLNEFKKEVTLKKARVYITFPCYQDISYNKWVPKIKYIETRLKKDSFALLGTPKRYEFPDSLTFDTPYHLIYKGVKLRTNLLIADLRNNLY